MAISGVLVHPTSDVREACVIGLGTGITSATLAKLGSVERVDTYEINPELRNVYQDYPDGMLRVLENPKVNMFWEDARKGLALRERSYDLIVTQPLHLFQAGSGLLNSREFFQLVRKRLNPGGVFCLYSNGSEWQRRALRETAARQFKYGETLYLGYLMVLSDQPLAIDAGVLSERFDRFGLDPLWQEIRSYDPTRDAEAVVMRLDRPKLSWTAHGLVITDDNPVIEYPAHLERRLRRLDGSE